MRYINIPNIISFSRLLVAPFFYYFFVSGNKQLVSLACWIFIIASITDFFDGWAARRFGIVTRYGEFIDPLADKVLTLLALTAFTKMTIIPSWMFLIIFARDVTSTTLRIIALAKGTPIVTSRTAKVKTTIEMVFISYVLILIYVKINFSFIDPTLVDKTIFSPFTYLFALIVTIMALYSLGGYLLKNKKTIKMFKKVEKIEKK
ncbi:MAG: CDP-diacylglycerol--glycerol-3-phosphate 3-phosphatidyltransferase [Ignavibacteria bacterium]|nr:CDP-diacylglycerol--glycerol-3-phosphate 3-phosphatidyltransferase [Ignavibacteria bacterium]